MQATKQTKQNTKGPTLVTRDVNIAELIFKYPELVELFGAFGLHCATCFASAFDTIEEGARLHGMSDEEIDEMIEEANKVIKGENVNW